MRIARGKRPRALALIGIMLMLSILALLAVLLVGLGSQNQRLARAEIRSEQALYASEAGLAVGTERYLRDASYAGSPQPESFGEDGSTYQIALYSDKDRPPSGAAVPEGHVLVEATGRAYDGTSRRVSALLTRRTPMPPQDNAIYGGESLDINGRIDFFDSLLGQGIAAAGDAVAMASSPSSSGPGDDDDDDDDDDDEGVTFLAAPTMMRSMSSSSMRMAYSIASAAPAPSAPIAPAPQPVTRSGTFDSGGNAHVAVGSDGEHALKLGPGSGVDGELRIPAGSEENRVFDDRSGNHKGVNSNYSPPTMVSVRLPLTPGDQDMTVSAGQDLVPGAYGHVVVDGGVLELNVKDLKKAAANGKKPQDLYVFRSLTLKNGGKVVLKEAAEEVDLTSTLYIDEKLEVVNGSFVNETGKPSRLQLYVTDSAPVDLQLRQGQDSHMMLYAPGSKVNLTEGDMYGSILGQKVTIGANAGVFYDKQLAKTTPDPWGNGGFFSQRKSYRRD